MANVTIKISPENQVGDWGNMEDWAAGDAVAPTGWTLTGASAAVAKEATIIKQGTFSAKVTRSGTDCFRRCPIRYAGRPGAWSRHKAAPGSACNATEGLTTTGLQETNRGCKPSYHFEPVLPKAYCYGRPKCLVRNTPFHAATWCS